MRSFREIERLAREAGPWTDADARRVKQLREQLHRTAAERDELAVLRRREIAEANRIRREGR